MGIVLTDRFCRDKQPSIRHTTAVWLHLATEKLRKTIVAILRSRFLHNLPHWGDTVANFQILTSSSWFSSITISCSIFDDNIAQPIESVSYELSQFRGVLLRRFTNRNSRKPIVSANGLCFKEILLAWHFELSKSTNFASHWTCFEDEFEHRAKFEKPYSSTAYGVFTPVLVR